MKAAYSVVSTVFVSTCVSMYFVVVKCHRIWAVNDVKSHAKWGFVRQETVVELLQGRVMITSGVVVTLFEIVGLQELLQNIVSHLKL